MVGVIDSFDAANHNITDTGGTSVITYSSQVFSADTILKGYTTSESLNILTWQQVQGKKSSNVVFPSILEHYNSKKELQDRVFIKDDFKLNLYDMHNEKMLILTQHSLYNQKHHPFLLCHCRHGRGVEMYESHECKIINHEEQIYLYNRSSMRYRMKSSDP